MIPVHFALFAYLFFAAFWAFELLVMDEGIRHDVCADWRGLVALIIVGLCWLPVVVRHLVMRGWK